MKKVVLVLAVMIIGVFTLMSFTNKENTTIKSEIVEQSSDCVRIYVKYSSGSKCTSGRVSGSVKYGGITDASYVNDYGYADICYSSDNSLNEVFIDGKGYEGLYKKGKSYTIYKR